MLIEFASSEAVFESFMEAVVLGVAVVSVMGATAFLGLVGRRKVFAVRVAGGLIFVGAASVLVIAYFSNYGRFTSAEVSSSGAKLVYPGPLGKEVFVPNASVKNVLFGLPGKTERKCYLRFEETTGESHRSVTVNRKKEECKILKSEISEILKT